MAAARKKPTQAVDKLVSVMSKMIEDAGFELVEGTKRKSTSARATLWEAHIQPKGSLRTHATIRFSLDERGVLTIGSPSTSKASVQDWYWVGAEKLVCDFADPDLDGKVAALTQDFIKKIAPLDRLAGAAPDAG